MRIDEQHITEPGLVVLDITAADEDTVRAVMNGLQQQWCRRTRLCAEPRTDERAEQGAL
ncbi:DUF6207 family protein [Streptomyces sp. NPDC058667]|uniref:DUF6207 family protein n=1 Tax=Streptomyces sp. NPDC058667 TaxID=3346588 RepID=UPI003659CB53